MIEQAVLHGVSQGGLSVAQGGKFGAAFLSGSFASLAGSALPANIDIVSGTAVSAIVGGTASVIGGGKFANGAATAAFRYAAMSAAQALGAAADSRKAGVDSQRKTGVQVFGFVDSTTDFHQGPQKLSIIGTEFDKNSWKFIGEVYGNGNEISLIAGHQIALESDLRPILPPSERRICEVDFDLMRPVFAKPFSWRIRWA